MSQSTELAAGERALTAFAEAWDAYCAEHKLPWPLPLIAIEDGVAIARFQSQRVSVRHCRTPPGDFLAALKWCTAEADSRWVPVVFVGASTDEFCARLARLLDRRIPW